MWHLIFVSIHAVFATAATAAALLVVFTPPRANRRGSHTLRAHTVCTAIMSGALPLSIASGWADFAGMTGPLFIGLFVLSLYMVWRSVRAERAWRVGDVPGVIDHVGFSLVALATGFFAVAVLRSGFGGIGVVAVAVGIPVLGHVVVHRLKARAARSDRPNPAVI